MPYYYYNACARHDDVIRRLPTRVYTYFRYERNRFLSSTQPVTRYPTDALQTNDNNNMIIIIHRVPYRRAVGKYYSPSRWRVSRPGRKIWMSSMWPFYVILFVADVVTIIFVPTTPRNIKILCYHCNKNKIYRVWNDLFVSVLYIVSV